MNVITVASRKGGAGKTTICAHLAAHAHAIGRRALLIDLEVGKLPEEEFEPKFAALLGVDAPELIDRLFAGSRPEPEMLTAVGRARAAGITAPIIPGIMPITNAAQVERFTMSCGAALPFKLAAELDRRRNDAQAVMQLGVAHATSQAIDLLTGGAPGIHFYTLNRSTATRDIFSALKVMGLVGSESTGAAAD